jgi:septal ring factor EnvC (AmiA/AmiB activator)
MDTISTHSSRSARPRKTKQEIFELEARLKVAAEENSGLKKNIQKLRDGNSSTRSKLTLIWAMQTR